MAEKKRNILLIGYTGSGKSTLANVLVNRNDFEEIFKESEGSISETKKVQSEELEIEKTSYKIIDTIGIGDTKLKQNEVLDIIAEAVYLVRNGVNQVLFIVNDRFEQHKTKTYQLLRTVIFSKEITDYTTIVRTKFDSFKNEKSCKEDISLMLGESDELKEILNSCSERIIHVSNPSVNIVAADDEDEDEKEEREELISLNKEARKESRRIIFDHLRNKCQKVYQPPKLKQLSEDIANDYFDYLKKKEELEKELERVKSPKFPSFKRSKSNASPSVTEINPASPIIPFPKGKFQEEDDIQIGEEKIYQLEGQKEKLQREITEKEKIIRQKVLKHILNNAESITGQLGGETFLINIADDGNDWTKIHAKFSQQELKLSWLKEFNYEEVKKWAKGLTEKFNPEKDLKFCKWLRNDKSYTAEKIQALKYVPNISDLRKEYAVLLDQEVSLYENHNKALLKIEDKEQDWTKIHPAFAEKKRNSFLGKSLLRLRRRRIFESSDSGEEESKIKTYQEIWQEKGMNYQSAKAWVEAGFEPEYYEEIRSWVEQDFSPDQVSIWLDIGFEREDCEIVKKWIDSGFDSFQTREWLENGLSKNECNLAKRAKDNSNISLEFFQQFKNWRKPQEWVDFFYSQEVKKNTDRLNLANKNLTGKLVIDGSEWTSLETINLDNNQISILELKNCNKLIRIDADNNQLTELKGLPNSLTTLYLFNNQLADLAVFSSLINLEALYLKKNNFTGSLEPLKSLNKLGILDIEIKGTDIDWIMQFLPETLKNFHYSEENFSEMEVKKINSFLTKKKVNQMYPDKKVKIMDNLYYENLKGELDLSEYPELEELNCRSNELTSLNLSQNFQLKKLICTSNNLKALDLSVNNQLQELDLSANQISELNLANFRKLTTFAYANNPLVKVDLTNCVALTEFVYTNGQLAELKLSGCSSLKNINCFKNQLTNLDLSEVNNLYKLDLWDNQLTELDLASLPISLTWLSIGDNNLTERDLSALSYLVNLTYLKVNNYDSARIQQGTINRWTGSLEPLGNLTQLEYLDLENTGVSGSLEPLKNLIKLEHLEITNSAVSDLEFLRSLTSLKKLYFSKNNSIKLEYLPENLEEIYCRDEELPELEKYLKDKSEDVYNVYDYQAWRKANQELVKKAQEEFQIQIPPK